MRLSKKGRRDLKLIENTRAYCTLYLILSRRFVQLFYIRMA